MSEVEEDLKSLAETLSAEAERLRRLQREMATLEADDPRLPALAEKTEALAHRLSTMTVVESELSAEVADAARG
jgi:type II secretory pathway component PulJ